MKTRFRSPVAGPAAAIALLALATAGVGGQESRPILRYGITEGLIEGASPTDVRAASLVWARGIADAVGLYSGAEATVYPAATEAARAMSAGTVDMLAVSTLEYFSIEADLKAVPAFAWKMSDEVELDFVLLARRGSEGLASAAGKSAVLYAVNRPWAISELWFDILLAEAGIRSGPKALSAVKYVRKGQASMAVFFGQADFAVESGSAFDTAVTLNPQLGRDLTILARSPKVLPGLALLNSRMSPDQRQRYAERAIRLHELVRYRQAFVVLRITEFVAWEPRFLASARALVNRHRQLLARR